METNSFKEYSALTIMSKEEQQPMKACLMFCGQYASLARDQFASKHLSE